jgi:hypothetical protein
MIDDRRSISGLESIMLSLLCGSLSQAQKYSIDLTPEGCEFYGMNSG